MSRDLDWNLKLNKMKSIFVLKNLNRYEYSVESNLKFSFIGSVRTMFKKIIEENKNTKETDE